MTRQIKFGEMGEYFEGKVVNTVRAVTLEWKSRVKLETPVDFGGLQNGWESRIEPFYGEITNRVEYAEPVCFGTNLPPSWGGKYRTRKGTRVGFPELIGKELEPWAQAQFRKD